MKHLFTITALALLLAACQPTPQQTEQTSPPADPAPSLDETLQGHWESLDDSLYHIHFENGHYYSDYEGVQDPSAAYQLVDSCGGEGAGETLVTSLDGTPMCYDIVKVDAQSLEMIYLSRGNTLRFRRME